MSQELTDRGRQRGRLKGGLTSRAADSRIPTAFQAAAGRAGLPTLEKVEAHFQQPELYLQNRVDIGVRRRMVKELLGRPALKSILDVGCGDGSISLQFLSDTNRLTLVDLSRNMLEICQRSTPDEFADRVTFVNADYVEHEFTEQFDIVLGIGVLAHVTRIGPAVAKLGALLKPGGDCIVQLTDAGRLAGRMLYGFGVWYGRFARGHGYSTNRTTADEMAALAERHGLVLAGERRYWPLLPGMKRLPEAWTSRFQMLGLRNRYFSRHGGEVLLHFKKISHEDGIPNHSGTHRSADASDAGSPLPATVPG